MVNAIFIIKPYWYNGTWVFDDNERGILKEPFVSGAPEIINWMVREIPRAKKGFKLLFSDAPFPGYQLKLDWLKEEFNGNWYRNDLLGAEGWLCSCLGKFYPEGAPTTLYAKAENLRKERPYVT